MNSISFYDGVGILPVHGFGVQKDIHTSDREALFPAPPPQGRMSKTSTTLKA